MHHIGFRLWRGRMAFTATLVAILALATLVPTMPASAASTHSPNPCEYRAHMWPLVQQAATLVDNVVQGRLTDVDEIGRQTGIWAVYDARVSVEYGQGIQQDKPLLNAINSAFTYAEMVRGGTVVNGKYGKYAQQATYYIGMAWTIIKSVTCGSTKGKSSRKAGNPCPFRNAMWPIVQDTANLLYQAPALTENNVNAQTDALLHRAVNVEHNAGRNTNRDDLYYHLVQAWIDIAGAIDSRDRMHYQAGYNDDMANAREHITLAWQTVKSVCR